MVYRDEYQVVTQIRHNIARLHGGKSTAAIYGLDLGMEQARRRCRQEDV
jgi:hypothetical protein